MEAELDVLVVDDEEMLCEVLEETLRGAGSTTRSAQNSAAAAKMIEESKPSLVLLDISMPGGSGLDLLLSLRAQGLRVATVMLTAHSESSRVIEALRLGAVDYVTKPFDRENLIERVPVWVELGRRLASLGAEGPDSVDQRIKMIELFRAKTTALARGATEKPGSPIR
jgi:DNA-binding response OmpR family regulator